MKDRYLFRGKRLDNGEWVEGFLYIDKFDAHEDYAIINDIGNPFNEYPEIQTVNADLIIQETLGQFTGLFDSKGVKIFEGDVVEWEINGHACVALIYYEENQACFWMGKESGVGGLVLNDWMRGKYTIVGNIHDNPELLEVQNG